uniref:Secreted protein n=1 Tax=Cacopsylla melanoneura TaxID=428564 RepID=A0A8D9E8U4_9HEMI
MMVLVVRLCCICKRLGSVVTRVRIPPPSSFAVTGWFKQVQTVFRLTVCSVHTGLDLRVYPQGRPFPHRTQQERLKVKEHFVVTISKPGWLMRNDGSEVTISTTIFDQSYTSGNMRIIRIRRHCHFHQLDEFPSRVGVNPRSQFQ